jgi:hypothetical protein
MRRTFDFIAFPPLRKKPIFRATNLNDDETADGDDNAGNAGTDIDETDDRDDKTGNHKEKATSSDDDDDSDSKRMITNGCTTMRCLSYDPMSTLTSSLRTHSPNLLPTRKVLLLNRHYFMAS